MYSRYHDRPVRVPENYGGVVFSDVSAAAKEPSPHRVEVAMPTPPRHSERKEIAVIPPPKTLRLSPRNDEAEAPLRPSEENSCGEGADASERKPSHAPDEGGLPFLKGLRFDDLLLLSLMLLLSQNDTDSDVVLWLALLLFCG